jgi:hypothetical protein
MELRFAFLVHVRRERYIVDADSMKKYQGGFSYSVPMDCNWSFRQFGEIVCSPYPWGLHDEVEFRYYDGGKIGSKLVMMKSSLPCLLSIRRQRILM